MKRTIAPAVKTTIRPEVDDLLSMLTRAMADAQAEGPQVVEFTHVEGDSFSMRIDYLGRDAVDLDRARSPGRSRKSEDHVPERWKSLTRAELRKALGASDSKGRRSR